MKIAKLEQVMLNFDEVTLDNLLGDLKDELLEWSFEGEKMTSKLNKIEIIIGVTGINLFKNEIFRFNFINAIEDKKVLQEIHKIIFKDKSSTFNQEELALKVKKIEFANNRIYNYIIHDFLNFSDYIFQDKKSENSVEILDKCGNTFFELYDYQYMIKQQAINDLGNPEKYLYKILIHMPTGTGKTKTAMHIVSHYINFISKGKGTVIWIADLNELLIQAYETFCNVWSHLGNKQIKIYKGWVEFPNELEDGIIFTSIQTLQRKFGTPYFDEISNRASLIIFDEVHKAGATQTKKHLDYLMKRDNQYGKKFIGLTATPGRTTDVSKNNSIFAQEFDNIIGIDVDKINSISLSESEARNYQGSKEIIPFFQENGYLSYINKEFLDCEIDPLIELQLKKEMSRLEYSDDLIKKIARNKSRNQKIIQRLIELNNNKTPTIVFACSLQHAKMLSAYLNLIDIKNSLVYGEMDPYLRQVAIDDFKSGKVNFIINFRILTTGFDSTNIKCVFITRPTNSVILYSQMIGRGLRGPRMGGNKTCLLIDVKENLIAFNETKAFKHFDTYWNKGE